MRYKANRGGHAPGHLRDWFWRYIEAGQVIDGDLQEEIIESITRYRLALRGKTLEQWLLGQLWNCRDIMPTDGRAQVRDILDRKQLLHDDREFFTYGQAVRVLMEGCEEAAPPKKQTMRKKGA